MSRIQDLLQHKLESVRIAKSQRTFAVPDDDRRIDWPRQTFRIIAEIKRASLSAGSIRSAVAVPTLARSYASAGASAISVLTEEKYFHGSLEDLRAAKRAVQIPVLQKDFILDPIQIEEAKANGSDFVLLIARFLSKTELNCFIEFCEQLKLNAIVEITNEADLLKIQKNVKYLGVNSRDLETLEVNTSNFARLRPHLPDSFLIAESGISTLETLNEVIDLQYHGALIGEHFLRCANPAQELQKFTHFARTKQHTRKTRQWPRVKICGITSEADAQLAIQHGADALGFVFAESPRRIELDLLASFRDRIPQRVLSVGVFKGQTAQEIHSLVQRFNLDVAQVYDPLELRVPYWKARLVKRMDELKSFTPDDGEPVLLDIKAEKGSLLEFWKEAGKQKIFAIAGGLHPGNVAQAISICSPEWVDVARGVERVPGKKDPDKLTAFFKELSHDA